MHPKDNKLASRWQSIDASRLPQARAWRTKAEYTQLDREALADSQKPIRKQATIIKDLGGTLDPKDQRSLNLANALISSAIQSRRDYEADIDLGTKHHRHTACGPPKAITGRGHFAVLKHNHANPQYMQVYDSSGIYSHSVPLKGPCRVDQLADNLRPSRPPATDSLASATLAVMSACRRHDVIMDQAIERADRLASRSHRASKKRGTRRRGSGKGQTIE